jgi:Ni/Fe-hydrogenase 1 B-type cytochrome subunit
MEPLVIHRISVWELPVRFFHWINAGCIVILSMTGWVIGRALSLQVGGEAYDGYWFGIVRFLHFLMAFLFFFNFVFRIYWGFVGNEHARWDQFIPYKRSQWKEIVEVLKVDILQTKAQPLLTIGHNSLAGVTYFLSFLAFLFQAVTGFGLYSAMSQSWFPRRFAWIVPMMGGDFAVRQWHHAMMWSFILFGMIHIYLTFYHDYVEGRGVISSMASGWKYIEQPDAKK